MKTFLKWAIALFLLSSTSVLPAQVPQLINYQGRVGVDGVNFDGSGQFKFAFVNAAGTTTYWSNDGSSTAGSEPTTAVGIPVSKGLYSILLGDATLSHMTIVPATVFTNGDVHLRVWFSDGVNGFQQLTPDRRIAAVGYAMMADSVSDGAITTAKLADGAVTSEKLAAGVVQSLSLKAPIASPTFTGSVTLPAGSTTTAPLMLQTGTNLTTPALGAVEFDGTNVFVTNNSASPTRKTIAFTDTPLVNAQIADGSVTSAKIANGSIGSAQLAAGAVTANLNSAGQSGVASGGLVLSATENAALIETGYIKIGETSIDDTWQRRNIETAPSARTNHTAIWTGTEMIVWGGTYNSTTLADGGRYNPSAKSWSSISQIGAPARENHAAFWTGTEMIILGYQQEVHLYNPSNDSWRVGATSGAPEYNTGRTTVWTGTELIVFGGEDSRPGRSNYNTGSRYNPVTGSWTALSSTDAPGLAYHTAVWTGSEMIVFGGLSFSSSLAGNGGRYNPTTDTWKALSTTNAPQGRYRHTAVWTGSEMIVWGGETSASNYATNYGSYNPSANEGLGSWVTLDMNSGPTGRSFHKAIWTGSEMIVFGGTSPFSGGRFNPTNGIWMGVSATGASTAPYGCTAVWTGSEMILYGGISGSSYFREVSSYKPGRQMYLYQRP